MYQKIRDLREDKDLTQTQIAKILNCSQRIYSNYERGEVDIPTQVLIKLAEFHGTSVDFLLGLTDEKRPYPRKRDKLTSDQRDVENIFQLKRSFEKESICESQMTSSITLIHSSVRLVISCPQK